MKKLLFLLIAVVFLVGGVAFANPPEDDPFGEHPHYTYHHGHHWQDAFNFGVPYFPPGYIVDQTILPNNRAKDIVIKMRRRLDEQSIHEGQVHHTIY